MKKNQRGFAEVATVFSSTMVIIISTLVFGYTVDIPSFGGSQETIGRAGFSGFVTDVDVVRTAFLVEGVTSLMGEQIASNNAVSEAQSYNYLAKGGTTDLVSDEENDNIWLSRAQANAIPCTRIEKETAYEALGIDLPSRVVNTWSATAVEMSYFVTNKGDVFVWPPYVRSDDGLFYINDDTTVKTPEGIEISDNNEYLMYEDGFEFDVDGVTIKVSSQTENTENILTSDISVDELKNMASIYYKDVRNAESPEGIESKFVFDSSSNGAPSKIVGADID